MRLFQALFRRKHMPPGHIYRGKRRIVKPVTIDDLQQLKTQVEIEEQTMFFLRHPYLTPEQSAGHAKALGKKEESFNKLRTKTKEFFENVTIESRLAHLRSKEGWD